MTKWLLFLHMFLLLSGTISASVPEVANQDHVDEVGLSEWMFAGAPVRWGDFRNRKDDKSISNINDQWIADLSYEERIESGVRTVHFKEWLRRYRIKPGTVALGSFTDSSGAYTELVDALKLQSWKSYSNANGIEFRETNYDSELLFHLSVYQKQPFYIFSTRESSKTVGEIFNLLYVSNGVANGAVIVLGAYATFRLYKNIYGEAAADKIASLVGSPYPTDLAELEIELRTSDYDYDIARAASNILRRHPENELAMNALRDMVKRGHNRSQVSAAILLLPFVSGRERQQLESKIADKIEHPDKFDRTIDIEDRIALQKLNQPKLKDWNRLSHHPSLVDLRGRISCGKYYGGFYSGLHFNYR